MSCLSARAKQLERKAAAFALAIVSNWVLSKEVNNINTKQVIYKKHVIDLLKIHGSINWIEKEYGLIFSEVSPSNWVYFF